MSTPSENQNLFRLELKIAKFLRYGVMVSGLTMLFAWVLNLLSLKTGWLENPFADLKVFRAVPMATQIGQAFQLGDFPTILSYAGLILLISLPVIRVFLTMILFFRQKERVLGLIALFVLVALLVSMGLGFEL